MLQRQSNHPASERTRAAFYGLIVIVVLTSLVLVILAREALV